ncbi:heme o synthase [Bartonella sp. DGB1]|uniref:heme o synthase n=1 Tax=Bartonella sp. DGB1 TaxID=3239807 RepID=UPI0035237A3E
MSRKKSSHQLFLSQKRQIFSDYICLLKPRVMSLVVFTAISGLLVAPHNLSILQAIISILSITIGAGASGALNMWYEADRDKLMKRTCKRPLPMGRISRTGALLFGSILAILSVFSLGYFLNYLAALLLAFTIFFYVVIYTIWLKPRTPQNIVIGGAAGAFPPLVAWVSATGDISIMPILLFLIIFLWTPPHFWALSLYTVQDYDKANIPMLPNVKGINYTKKYILIYSILMSITAIMPAIIADAKIYYAIASFILGIIFIIKAIYLYQEKNPNKITLQAKSLFKYSLIYLFLIFLILLFDHYLK